MSGPDPVTPGRSGSYYGSPRSRRGPSSFFGPRTEEEQNEEEEERERYMRRERNQGRDFDDSLDGVRRLLLEREAAKLVLNPLPDTPIEYVGWRFQTKVKPLDLVPLDSSEAFDYHRSIDIQTLAQLRVTPTSIFLRRVDNKLYTAVVGCVRGANNLKYLLKLETDVTYGNGRMALKRLDVAHRFNAEALAEAGSDTLQTAKISEMGKMEEHIAILRRAFLYIRSLTGAEAPDVLSVRWITRSTDAVTDTDLAAGLANFRRMAGEDKAPDALLDLLDEVSADWKMRQPANAKTMKAAAAKFNNNTKAPVAFDGVCHWCQIRGHRIQDCRKKAAGQPRAKKKAAPGGGGNPAGPAPTGGAPRTPNDKKKCDYCHKPGHTADVCFKKKKDDAAKATTGAPQGAASTGGTLAAATGGAPPMEAQLQGFLSYLRTNLSSNLGAGAAVSKSMKGLPAQAVIANRYIPKEGDATYLKPGPMPAECGLKAMPASTAPTWAIGSGASAFICDPANVQLDSDPRSVNADVELEAVGHKVKVSQAAMVKVNALKKSWPSLLVGMSNLGVARMDSDYGAQKAILYPRRSITMCRTLLSRRPTTRWLRRPCLLRISNGASRLLFPR